MSAESFDEDVSQAVDRAILGDADLDDIEAVLRDKLDRVEEARKMRGEA